ncbi:MAG: peptidylprolyl isomerase [Candidatus Thalassarchaeaceae archaeon]|nr:peptidylprolyl isomerase [Candidatus Thalassarchaeaceae archaeon]
MASDALKQAWDSAQKKIDKGEAESALEILRTDAADDAALKEVTTWRIAGDAKAHLARESGIKKMYRDAVNHYEQALKCNQNDKKSRRALNSLRSEMDGLGIRAGGKAVFWDDGAPTFVGLVAFVVVIGLLLVSLKVIPDYLAEEVEYDAIIEIELYPDAAPKTVASFKEHAAEGRYDGIVFHRIIDGFMIQGGDIENGDIASGWSSAGTGGYSAIYYNQGQQNDMTSWTMPDEFDSSYRHAPGILAMANSGPNTGGSQFYLVDKDSTPSHLDDKHSVFGLAVSGEWMGDEMSGINVIDHISTVPVDESKPTSQIPTIQKVEINGDQATMYINLLDEDGNRDGSNSLPGFSVMASMGTLMLAAVAIRRL